MPNIQPPSFDDRDIKKKYNLGFLYSKILCIYHIKYFDVLGNEWNGEFYDFIGGYLSMMIFYNDDKRHENAENNSYIKTKMNQT